MELEYKYLLTADKDISLFDKIEEALNNSNFYSDDLKSLILREVTDIYYDTKFNELNSQGITYRLRKYNKHTSKPERTKTYIVTLKASSQNTGDLTIRHEFESAISEIKPEIPVCPENCEEPYTTIFNDLQLSLIPKLTITTHARGIDVRHKGNSEFKAELVGQIFWANESKKHYGLELEAYCDLDFRDNKVLFEELNSLLKQYCDLEVTTVSKYDYLKGEK